MSSGSVVVLVLVVVVAAVAGVAAGSFAASSIAASATPVSVATDAATGVAGPDGVPPMTDGFPDAGEPYLPEVTFESLEQAWLETEPDWTCETNAGTAGDSTTCRPPDPNLMYNINVAIGNDYQEPERVRFVEGSCIFDGPGGLGESRCKSFYADVSDLVFTNQPNVRRQARKWARNNATSDNSTVIGGIRLKADLGLHTMKFESEFAPAPG